MYIHIRSIYASTAFHDSVHLILIMLNSSTVAIAFSPTLSTPAHTHTHTHNNVRPFFLFSLTYTLPPCPHVLINSAFLPKLISYIYAHTLSLSLFHTLYVCVCVCVIPYPTQGHHHQPFFVVVFPSLTSTQSLSLSHSLSVYSKYNHVCIYLTLSHNNSQIHAPPTTPLNHFAFVRCTLSRLQFSLCLSEISSLRLSPVSRLAIQNPARERHDVFKIQQERANELLKIQQQREGVTQNPAREREGVTQNPARESDDLFKIQQERER